MILVINSIDLNVTLLICTTYVNINIIIFFLYNNIWSLNIITILVNFYYFYCNVLYYFIRFRVCTCNFKGNVTLGSCVNSVWTLNDKIHIFHFINFWIMYVYLRILYYGYLISCTVFFFNICCNHDMIYWITRW